MTAPRGVEAELEVTGSKEAEEFENLLDHLHEAVYEDIDQIPRV